jgi:hypothetical protein
MLKCLGSFNTTLTWLGAISRHSCQRLGSNRICNRRISVGSLSDSVLTTDPNGTCRYHRVCNPAISCQPVRTILRYLSYCDCLLPLHRREHHLVICKLRARWQTRRIFRNPPDPHQHRRCCVRPDLPEQRSAQVHFGPCVEFGLFGFCVVRMVDYQGDIQKEREKKGC